MERRKFLLSAGLLSTALYASRFDVIAGPFSRGELNGLNIPEDKKLDPAWVKSLYKRGNPTKYFKSKDELQYIGMPVGGLNCGSVYLGGDGRLWLWDIFNDNREGINPKVIPWEGVREMNTISSRHGSAYVSPAKDVRPIDQGFAFRISAGEATVIKRMIVSDWEDIIFEAGYPIATITFIDEKLPVQIIAEVFSPFIPLDERSSSLPGTIYAFKIRNKTKGAVKVEITGWLENKAGIHSGNVESERRNITEIKNGKARLLCSIRSRTGDRQILYQPDYGTLCLASLSAGSRATARLNPENDADLFASSELTETLMRVGEKLIGGVSAETTVGPGETSSSSFVISWHFPNLSFKEIPDKGRFYNTLFKSAAEVCDHVDQNSQMLVSTTRLWRDTFYDSSLPYWFLERTFLTISCLATTTSHQMESGRYYAWEGVGCCPGTCTHVWQYAQACSRIFPGIEKDIRERIDLGLAYQKDGSMWYRCEADQKPAVDGQAGTILRFYREHQMNPDSTFLVNNWSKIKTTILFLMTLDKDKDGMEDTPLENTLDAMWDGEIAWIVGLCIAAVKAGQKMAEEMKDDSFASVCREYVEKGKKNMEEKLFNGEYFIHRADPMKGRTTVGSYNTCHIDQVFGQSWAFQLGLGRVIDRDKTLSALKSLWKYNFTPDVGPYIKEHPGGRPYALAGEGGLIMNSNPAKEAKPYGDNVSWQMGYFHECMTGFEHQVASHMMAEGMIDESLVITRTIHDRYHASKRNPFNEVECSDHYARAMASYGTFITACGFEYHGPKGYMRFAPKITPENFTAPFVAAQGWGTYHQRIGKKRMEATLVVKYGQLRLETLSFDIGPNLNSVAVVFNGKNLPAKFSRTEKTATIQLANEVTIDKDQKLEIGFV